MACWAPPKDPISSRIDKEILKDREVIEKRVKVLLLGTGDSGKSTFLKQMKVIHKQGFSNGEVLKFSAVLQDNCLESMKTLLTAFDDDEDDQVPQKDKAAVLEADDLNECADRIAALWKLDAVKDVFAKRVQLNLPVPSTAPYFFENAQRFAREDFRPSSEDILRVKLKTTGVIEVNFTVEGQEFTMVDVGGQRSERRKWIHCFDDASVVIFLAALDEYDMVLEEDENMNRMQESMELFSQVSLSKFFPRVTWILFLNKSDLFKQKLKEKPLEKFISEFKPPSSSSKLFEEACRFMEKKYRAGFNPEQRLYCHVTCALDTDNCEKVFTSVRDQVITGGLTSMVM